MKNLGQTLKQLGDGLSSTRLGVGLMVLLGVICGVGTFYEMSRGTAAVQEAIYGTPWFAGLMAVLGINVFLAMMAKYPWNRFQGGFVAAHIGIVLLLVGSLVSLRYGLDASLQLQEGERSDRVAAVGRGLHALLPGAAGPVPLTAPVDEAAIARGEARFVAAGSDVAVVLEKFAPHVELVEGVMEAEAGGPALRLALHGSFGHVEEWLMDGGHGHAQASFGPLSIELFAAADEAAAAEALKASGTAPRLAFAMLPGGRVLHSFSGSRPAQVEPGVEIATPWMGMKFSVLRALERAEFRRDVAETSAPVKLENRLPALKAHLEGPQGRSPSFWLVWGEPQSLRLEEGEAQVAFAAPQLSLPFQVTLLDFTSEKYPGSRMAATYESRVRIDDPEQGASEHLVSMNRPLHYRGYTFFQSSFIEGQPMTSILSVARAPGLPLVYAGTLFITLGIVFMYVVKPWLVRRTAAQALQARQAAGALPARAAQALARSSMRASLPVVLLSVAALGATSPTFAAPAPGDGLAGLAIQDAGRVKPLDTFARETARRVGGAKAFGGGDHLEGLQPAEWAMSVFGKPEEWRAKPIFRVTHAGLRDAIALPKDRDRFSFEELVGHDAFLAAAERIRARLQSTPDASPDPVEQEVLDLEGTLVTFRDVMDGHALTVVPPADDPNAAWLSLADVLALDEAAGGDLRPRVIALREAARAGDRAALETRAAEIGRMLAARAPSAYPSALTLERELTYNRAKPFRSAWMLYLVGFLALISSFPLASTLLSRLGVAALVLGLGSLSWGLWLRTVISGRTPLTNMYETVVFVAWGAVALALVFDLLHRSKVSMTVASGLGVLALILADNAPILDGSIHPLVPVLRDNFWLTTHVLTIMLGYAALFLAMGLGHVNLGLVFFAPGRVALLKTLTKFLLRAMQVGTLFLAAGTLLGGVWASYSWGRFWGWDPKETWSLIACLGYLAILHGRLLGWLKDFGLAVGSILGFLLVLMAWYGVNYILGTGLHSYGFGSGGYTWIVAFVVFEVVVIGAALWRWRTHHARGSAGAAVPEPTRA